MAANDSPQLHYLGNHYLLVEVSKLFFSFKKLKETQLRGGRRNGTSTSTVCCIKTLEFHLSHKGWNWESQEHVSFCFCKGYFSFLNTAVMWGLIVLIGLRAEVWSILALHSGRDKNLNFVVLIFISHLSNRKSHKELQLLNVNCISFVKCKFIYFEMSRTGNPASSRNYFIWWGLVSILL